MVFKYTSRKTAKRVFSVTYIKEKIVKTIKTDHLNIKARYRFNASLFGLLAICITEATASKYPIKIGCTNIGNKAAAIKRPKADNQLFFKVLIFGSSMFFYGANYKNL